MEANDQTDFLTAMGESFGDSVSPPVPFEDASPHECCEVIWRVIGRDVTPERLTALAGRQITNLAVEFGCYFECDPPTYDQIKNAIATTLARWPIVQPRSGDMK